MDWAPETAAEATLQAEVDDLRAERGDLLDALELAIQHIEDQERGQYVDPQRTLAKLRAVRDRMY